MLLRGPHGVRNWNRDKDDWMWEDIVVKKAHWHDVNSDDESTWPAESTFFWGMLNNSGRPHVDYCYRQAMPDGLLSVNNAWYDGHDVTGIRAWCELEKPQPPTGREYEDINNVVVARRMSNGEAMAPLQIGLKWVRLEDCLPPDRLATDYGRRLLWFLDYKDVVRQGVYSASGFVHFAFGSPVSIVGTNFLKAWRIVEKPNITGEYLPIIW